ncbi:MAG: hypothetical protein ABJE66_02985 [Deltaproteobacteria bacterium]
MARSIAEVKAALQNAFARKGAAAGVVAAEAAKIVEEHGLVDETPALVAAFTRLSEPERDPGCRGRSAIVAALHTLDHWAPEVFEAGLRVLQIEGDPRFPGNDSGALIRGACAQAHAHFNRPNALDVCAEMLADIEIEARDDLIAFCRRDPRRRQAIGYLALALLRDDEANAELERAIEEGSVQDAEAAKSALATFR